MTTFIDLVKAIVTSVGDPREPVKVVLSDLWDNLFNSADVEELFINAFYEACLDEARDSYMPWTKDKIKDILKYQIDLSYINFSDLDLHNQQSLFNEKLMIAFHDVAIVPDMVKTPTDFEEITNKVIYRFKVIFVNELSKDENTIIFRKLITKHAIDLGIKEQEILKMISFYFPQIALSTDEIIKVTKNIQEEVIEVKNDIQNLVKAIDDRSKTARRNDYNSIENLCSLNPETKQSLLERLFNYEENLNILEDQISNYVLQEQVPPQYLKNIAIIKRKIDGIKKELGLS